MNFKGINFGVRIFFQAIIIVCIHTIAILIHCNEKKKLNFGAEANFSLSTPITGNREIIGFGKHSEFSCSVNYIYSLISNIIELVGSLKRGSFFTFQQRTHSKVAGQNMRKNSIISEKNKSHMTFSFHFVLIYFR